MPYQLRYPGAGPVEKQQNFESFLCLVSLFCEQWVFSLKRQPSPSLDLGREPYDCMCHLF